MNHRERVLAALSHHQPDRVPIDMSGSLVSGINARAYDRVKRLLGLELGHTRILDRMNQLAVVDEEVLDLFGVDTRGVRPGAVEDDTSPTGDDQSEYTDAWGIVRRITPDVDTYFVVNEPLSGEISLHDVLAYPWPDPEDPVYTEGLRSQVEHLRALDDRAIVLSLPGSVIQMSQLIRGFSAWYTDIALAPDLICALMDRILEIQMTIHGRMLDKVGDLVDVAFFFDDLAMQDRLIVSPSMYRKHIQPRLAKYVSHLKSKTGAKLVHHCDGAIAPVLDSLADMGIDAINPVQVSAKGMGDTVALKRDFGVRLSFWGGVDTQSTLPHGTPDDVRAETAQRIAELGASGGYVLGAVHNIQSDVPAGNIVAMFETALGRRLTPAR